MRSGETGRNANDPQELYSRRLEQLRSTQRQDEIAEKRLAYAKLAVASIIVVSALVLLYYSKFLWLLLLPAAIFLYLTLKHEMRLQQIRERDRSINFYQRGIARIQDRWAGTGETGERFLEPAHPYARDLDLFGPASLFELLCTARTRAGEETLARWLLSAAPITEIRDRQGAISDLTDRVDLRERIFCTGESVRAGVHPDALADWGERRPLLDSRRIHVTSTVLALLWVGGLLAWGVWGQGTVALAISALNLAWAHRIHARWDEAADKIEEATHDLDVLAGVIRLIDHGQFAGSRLNAIQARLKHANFVPSDAIRRLDRIVGYLEHRRNPAMRLLDVLT